MTCDRSAKTLRKTSRMGPLLRSQASENGIIWNSVRLAKILLIRRRFRYSVGPGSLSEYFLPTRLTGNTQTGSLTRDLEEICDVDFSVRNFHTGAQPRLEQLIRDPG